MKYIRKFTALILSVIFLVALVISAGVLLSVRNVNVRLLSYTGVCDDRYGEVKEKFSRLKGTSLLFLDGDEVSALIDGDGEIAFVGYEKVFPCTVNITVKERVECLAYEAADGYDFYDDRGVLMRKGSENVNPIDSCPDVLVLADDAVTVGEVATMCSYFLEIFASFRSTVQSVTVSSESRTLVYTLYRGLRIEIEDYATFPREKTVGAYKAYEALNESQSVRGTLRVSCAGNDVGAIKTQYSA